tara:strand:+ start:141 stop:395 length:255 start_codon:yes stop_codon:yes gene_type:complete
MSGQNENTETFASIGRNQVLKTLVSCLEKHKPFTESYPFCAKKYGIHEYTIRNAIPTRDILKAAKENRRSSNKTNRKTVPFTKS